MSLEVLSKSRQDATRKILSKPYTKWFVWLITLTQRNEREDGRERCKIRELESKLLEGRKFQHLGCDKEIQILKSTITDLEKELKGPATAMSAITVLPNEIELREKEQEKEIHNLKFELSEVKNLLKHTEDKLEVK